MKKTLVVVLALALMAVGLAPAVAQQAAPAGGTLEKINQSATLTIGTRTGSPPFAYVNAKNEWVGFSIDLVEELVKPAIEKKLGKPIKLEKKESTPPTRIPLLTSRCCRRERARRGSFRTAAPRFSITGRRSSRTAGGS